MRENKRKNNSCKLAKAKIRIAHHVEGVIQSMSRKENCFVNGIMEQIY